MTTGLKTPSHYYMELINTFPPRPIANEDELDATQERINTLLDKV
jgi:HTH-type transcriptional regulator / antitoxin HigA